MTAERTIFAYTSHWPLRTLLLFVWGCAPSNSSFKTQRPQSAPPPEAQESRTIEEDSELRVVQNTTPAPARPTPRKREYIQLEGFLPTPTMRPTVLPTKDGFPVVFVAHGAGGRGESHCEFWDIALPPNIWLVCPTGSLLRANDLEGGAYFPDHLQLRMELNALRGHLLSTQGSEIQKNNWLYIGYSQGATMGALAIVPTRKDEVGIPLFTALILIEGGGEYWTTQRATQFGKQGGRRALFGCGTPGCLKHAQRSTTVLRTAEIKGTVVSAPGAGHTYRGEVGRQVIDAWLGWQ